MNHKLVKFKNYFILRTNNLRVLASHTSVAEAVEVFEMVEVALLAHTHPNHLGGVGEAVGDTIDTREGETSVTGEIFHEYDADLIVADGGEIPLAVFLEQKFFRFGTVAKRFERQVFGDGRHQAVGVAFIMEIGVLILWCPYV